MAKIIDDTWRDYFTPKASAPVVESANEARAAEAAWRASIRPANLTDPSSPDYPKYVRPATRPA